MNNPISDNGLKLEILISTMHKSSLSFLKVMFPYHNIEKLNILIINQTERENDLKSNYKNIRIINSYEKGLSLSRNLALKNAIGDICLIADDDVEYLPDFEHVVFDIFSNKENVSIIRFKILTFCGTAYKNYPKSSKKLTRCDELKNSSSIELVFKRKHITNKNISFNSFFGLGSYFESGEEYLFLKEAFNKGLIIYFENSFIVKHKLERSTSNIASDNFVRAKAGLYFYDYKYLSYLLLFKFIIFLLRKRVISLNEVVGKYKVGVSAINKYIELKRLND